VRAGQMADFHDRVCHIGGTGASPSGGVNAALPASPRL
jgi:hypothetical protein